MTTARAKSQIVLAAWPVPVLMLVLTLLPSPWAGPDAAAASSVSPTTPQPRSGAQAVPEPDLGRLEAVVQERLREARAELTALTWREEVDQATLAEAYGELGRLYHAHHLLDSAASCYRTATLLSPSVFRWHYLLGVVLQETNQLEAAVAALEQALRLRPSDDLARLHLAQVYRQRSEPQHAEPLLGPLLARPDVAAAAQYELGQIALGRRDYEQAVTRLERVLLAQPGATRIHFPLAMAYRGLGDVARARQHLAQQGDGDVVTPDPLVENIAALSTSARAHVERALRAVRSGRFDVAGFEFEQAVAANPDDIGTRVRWARALYITGAKREARVQLAEALRRDPDHAPAHLFAGALAEEEGRDDLAVDHYRRALASDPGMILAEFFLGNALMRQAETASAARHYARVVDRAPHIPDARLMEVMALLRSGAPHGQLQDRLENAVAAFPEDPRLMQALARLLAASPDDHVRDGARALELAENLYQTFQSAENGELLAMAYAEVGRYDRAAAVQRDAIAATELFLGSEAAARLEENLQRYENGQPCRRPWRGDEALFYPPPIGSPAFGS